MFGDIKKLGKESLIYGLSTVLARLLNFVLMPFYTHYLIPAQYGIVATVFSYIAFLNIIYGYGLNQGYMRYYDEKKSLVSSFNVIFYTSFIISLFIIFLSKPLAAVSGIGAVNWRLVVYSSVILYLDSLTLVPFADLRMKHKAYSFVGVRSASITLNVALNIVLLKYSNYGVDGIFIANIASSFLAVLMFSRYFSGLFSSIDYDVFKKMFFYSVPFLPAGLSSMAIQVIDRPIMLKLTSPYWVGIYQANYRLAIFMSLIVTMFDQAWRPFVIERANDKNAPVVFSGVFKYFTFFMAFIWLALSFFIENVAKFSFHGVYLINPDYWYGLSVIPIVMGAYFFNGIYINFIAPVIIKKNTYIIMAATITGAGLNVVFNFILIPRYNIMGAAWSAFISYIVMAFLMKVLARKIYPIPYDFRKLAVLSASALSVYLIYFLYSPKLTDCQNGAFKVFLLLAFSGLVYVTHFFSKEETVVFSDYLRRKIERK